MENEFLDMINAHRGIILPLSFLPRNIEKIGLVNALAERMIPIAVGVLLFFLARKLGAFSPAHEKKFKEDLNELESLKKMAAELSE